DDVRRGMSRGDRGVRDDRQCGRVAADDIDGHVSGDGWTDMCDSDHREVAGEKRDRARDDDDRDRTAHGRRVYATEREGRVGVRADAQDAVGYTGDGARATIRHFVRPGIALWACETLRPPWTRRACRPRRPTRTLLVPAHPRLED